MNRRRRSAMIFIALFGILTIIVNIMNITERAAYKKLAGMEPQAVCEPAAAFEPATMIFTEDEADELYARLKEENEKAHAVAEEKKQRAKMASYSDSYSAASGNDRFYLAAVVCQEVGNMDTQLMMMVANVVMNRVASPHFPNSIYGVLTQRYQYGMMWKYGVRFPSYATERMKTDCYAIADRILAGERVMPSNVIFQAEFPQGTGTYAYYPVPYGLDLYFCYG